MFIKILEYDYCNGINKKNIMSDKELVKLNNEVLLAGDCLTTFTQDKPMIIINISITIGNIKLNIKSI